MRTTKLRREDHVLVGQDTGKLCGGEISECRANSCESSIGRSEDSYILKGVDCADEVGLCQSTGERGQVCSYCGGRIALWDGQDVIDDVDHTAGEVDILLHVNLHRQGTAFYTYRGSDRASA